MSAVPTTNGRWIDVTPHHPCPACGKSKWCGWSPDLKLLRCRGTNTATPPGMRKVQSPSGDATLYAVDDDLTGPAPKPPAKANKTTAKVYSTAALAIASYERRYGERSDVWTYHDVTGEPVAMVVRFRDADGNKQDRPVSRVAGGWVCRGMETPRPLYGLHHLADADEVFVGEGEKTAEAIKATGLVGTTSPNGCSSPHKADWSLLSGKAVRILPDNDKDGDKYAAHVQRLLGDLNPPAEVRVVRLIEHYPDLPPGGDLADVLAAGHDPAAVRAVIEDAAQASAPAEGVSPVALPDDLPAVMPFDFDLLPLSLRPWVLDIAERIQCPPDFPAVAAVLVLASVVGRKVCIRPKRQDEWLVVPNLWGAVVGRPGIMKTPALAESMKVLQRLEAEAKAHYDVENEAFEASSLVRDARQKLAKQQVAAAVKDGGDADAIAAAAVADVEARPTRRRYIVNDSTVEKLGELLNQNSNGLLTKRDELIGLLKSMEKEGRESDRAFYLEAWNGGDRFTYDRIGRGTVEIEACCVSVLGGIQPGPLGDYLRDAVKGGKGDDGFIQRFQLMVYPDISGTWRNVDRFPDSAAKDTAWQTYRRLDTMGHGDFGGVIQDDGDLPALRFSDAAQTRFDQWRHEMEPVIRSGELPVALEAVKAKQRSLVPTLALLFHLADNPSAGEVGSDAIERALRWIPYLDSHAERIYASVSQLEVKAAKSIITKIKAGGLSNPFTLRDVYRPQWSGLTHKADAQAAVDLLVDYDWLDEQRDDTGGKPKILYYLRGQTDITDNTPASPLLSGLSVTHGADVGKINSPPERKVVRV